LNIFEFNLIKKEAEAKKLLLSIINGKVEPVFHFSNDFF